MRPRVLVHGGIDCPDVPEVRAALARAAEAGLATLLRDGDPCDAVVAAISVLEDDPLFNAGYGSVLNRDGHVEVDAGIAYGGPGRRASSESDAVRHATLPNGDGGRAGPLGPDAASGSIPDADGGIVPDGGGGPDAVGGMVGGTVRDGEPHGVYDDGGSRTAGRVGGYAAVGAVPGVRNPVRVARLLLAEEDGPVLLVGEGAARYAVERGIDTGSLVTDEQLESWRSGSGDVSRYTGRAVRTETVGCVAVTPEGLAAGSSTGGFQGKVPGRVGDAAVFGAGFYADPYGAAVCSGLGEATMPILLAQRAVRLVSEGGGASEAVRELLGSRDISAGALTYDLRTGRASAAHRGASFPVMSAAPGGTEHIPSVSLEGL